MNIKETIAKSLMEGYASMELQISDILVCMICTVLIAMYVFGIYKRINKNFFTIEILTCH